MRSVEILKKLAVYGGVAAVIGAAFCHHRIQANLASMEYYKMSIDEFKKHQGAVDSIGHPVRFTYMNLGRKDIQVNHVKAQIVIPVKGSKSNGNLYSFSTREDVKDRWSLKELQLEVKSNKQIIPIIEKNDDTENITPV